MESIEHSTPKGERPRLKKQVVIGLIVLMLALAAIGWWLQGYEAMPGYGGKTAEQWLLEVSGQNRMAALHAFEQMRPKSLPFLVRAMDRKESVWHKIYKKIYPKFPGWLRGRLSPPAPDYMYQRIWNGTQIALLREPDARTALPALARILHDNGITYHTFVAYTILRLAKEGDNGYTRDLAVGLHDKYPQVRQYVAQTFTIIGPAAKPAIPALKAALDDPSPDARVEIAWALWNVDHATNACREALIGALKAKPSNPLDQMAILHLMEIDPHDASFVPVLMERMQKESEPMQAWDCGILQQIGPPAKDAVPLLTERAQKGGPNLRKAAIAALKEIDSETAAKYETK